MIQREPNVIMIFSPLFFVMLSFFSVVNVYFFFFFQFSTLAKALVCIINKIHRFLGSCAVY